MKELKRNLDQNPQPFYAASQLRIGSAIEIGKILNEPLLNLNLIEAPTKTGYDYGVNLGEFAKSRGINPQELGQIIEQNISQDLPNYIHSVVSVGPFLNFRVDMPRFGDAVLHQILNMADEYGKENVGHGQIVIIDMSSPNIAKRMTYGHLRSTIIGDALANLYRSQGYEVIRDNHIGDWGTQFGKLIVALRTWGSMEKLLASEDRIEVLNALYVKFHDEVEKEAKPLVDELKMKVEKDGLDSIPGLKVSVERETKNLAKEKKIKFNEVDPNEALETALRGLVTTPLEEEGRKEFLKLEQGDLENREIWKLCVDLSLIEFDQIYEMLGVSFEKTLGESFYENQLQDVMRIVRESDAGSISNGALVIDMRDKNLDVAIVQKSDGASLYITRDLACAIYREQQMGADKVVYVVGEDQKQYFQQLFESLRRLGYKVGDTSEHVYFGMVKLKEGKMSTRKGNVVLLKDVISDSLKRATQILEGKLEEKNDQTIDEQAKVEITRQVAIGVLKWNDLSQDPRRPIKFDLDHAINMTGNSSAYVQYTAIRARHILENSGFEKTRIEGWRVDTEGVFEKESERALIRQLAEYPNILKEALDQNLPSKVASYVYQLSKKFTSFYNDAPVLSAENNDLIKSRLKLTAASLQVITNALGILGIEVPERM